MAGEEVGYDQEFSEGRARQHRRLADDGHGQYWGAFEDGRLLASMGLFRASPGLARFQTVKTHPDARGRGLAGHAGARDQPVRVRRPRRPRPW